jgi:hypothetical protein
VAFRRGDESEALLTCLKCKGAYPIDAMFCGFCGASRSIALGIERDPDKPNSAWSSATPEVKSVKGVPIDAINQSKSTESSSSKNATNKQNTEKSVDKKKDSPAAKGQLPDVEITPTGKSKKKVLVAVLVIVVLAGGSITAVLLNSSRNVQTASEMTTEGPCAIDDSTVAHLVDMKNLVDSIPSGSNEGENKDLILNWAKSALETAGDLKQDQDRAIGSAKTLLYNSSKDLSELANLANQWANKNYSNPETFVSDYKVATEKVIAAYKSNSDACEDRIPKA